MSAYPTVKTVEEFRQQPEEYQSAVRKIVRSHALNELYGAQVFDEPAIKLAPTPYAKWLTCRVAMEEYHHHVRFKELADQIGVAARGDGHAQQAAAQHLRGAAEELGAVLRDQDARRPRRDPAGGGSAALLLRAAAQHRAHHHAGGEIPRPVRPGLLRGAGRDRRGAREGAETRSTAFIPTAPEFFGASGSKNNEIFRKYGLKLRSNEDMRADYMARAKSTVTPLGITLPEVRMAA